MRLAADFGETFPAPPLEETPGIEPITTLDELAEEGASMEHCVPLYARRIPRAS